MQLEDYFLFEKFDSPYGPYERIRIKGHRIALENILEFYKQGESAEYIARVHYPSLTLDEVNAAVAYYEQNKEAVEAYLKRGEEVADGVYQEWLRTHKPSALEQKLRALRAGEAGPKHESA